MSHWHLAQLNVARPLAPLDTPLLADFVGQLDKINALAEASPGFVWRLAGESGSAVDIKAADPTLIVNLSVWTSAEALFDFVYKSAHTAVMARRREWFERLATFQVLFWMPAGQLPGVDEAMRRLSHLEQHGPTPEAFTFKRRYPAPDSVAGPVDLKPEPYCVA